MDFFTIIAGLILLTLGRKLFWLCIALIGFAVGMEMTGLFLINQPFWFIVLAGILAGLLGAILSVFAQRVAFALAGFFAGGYLVLIAARSIGSYNALEVFFIIGGITGVLLSVWFMDWAIIMLSCFAGAGMILNVLPLGKPAGLIVFVVLVSVGIFVQGWQLQGGGTERGKEGDSPK